MKNKKLKGVWIDADIWICKSLSLLEKHFLQRIRDLDNDKGCYANNAFFSSIYSISKSRCTQIITSLKDKKTIKVTLIKKEKQITNRVLNFLNTPIEDSNEGIEDSKHPIYFSKHPYLENAAHSNIKESNIIKEYKESIKEKNKEIEDLKKEIEKLKNSSIDSKESTIDLNHLKYIKDYLFICEQFTSITGKGIRNKKTDTLIGRSDKYKMIKARLKEGATVDELIKVIEIKTNEWKGTDWAKYLRFNTLFSKKNFEGYLDQLEETAPASSENHPDAPTEPKERFKYFRARFERYKPHLEKRKVNTEYRDRIYQKKDAEGLIRDLERANPELIKL